MVDLRSALKARGKRQRDIAVACGVTEPTVSRWVQWITSGGSHGVPIPAKALPIISDLSGVEISALIPPQQAA